MTEKMHHFYLWGKLDNDTLPIIPGVADIKKSYVRYNGKKHLHKHMALGIVIDLSCPLELHLVSI